MSFYNQEIASHYAAYRPPLHQIILQKCLKDEYHHSALDIGCGTGQSSVALLPFCDQILGIDPSREMLAKAQVSEKITYQYSDGKLFPVDSTSISLFSFAGSLFYAKSQQLVEEIARTTKAPATILVYDFEVQLAEWYELLEVTVPPDSDFYDHKVDFSDLEIAPMRLKQKEQEVVGFPASFDKIAHLLLSTPVAFEALGQKFGSANVHRELTRFLIAHSEKEATLKANIFYSIYKID